tara:strand:- start:424 stop:1467 length:1044 start_codon:yes stop_codon:yes gene_type:complete
MSITTIGQLLDQMGVVTRVFDLGRHIQELDVDTFSNFEQQAIAYPAPYLHHAWIGLLFWDPDTPEIPLLWFIKLPLDEQGKLIPSERDQFLQQLLVALGSNIEASKQGKQLAAVLEGNPYVFKPSPERQAAMHAKANHLLNNPTSSFYPAALDYLQSDLQQWQQLGMQGLADLCVRWSEHQTALIHAIATMPAEPLNTLCHCLENETINGALGKALSQRLLTELEHSELNEPLLAALVRGISQCRALELRNKLLSQVLASPANEIIEVLAAIGTRCSNCLTDPQLCLDFLEALCRQGQHSFNQILADLLYCAPIRPHILGAFRNPHRSEELAQAIGALLSPPKNEVH